MKMLLFFSLLLLLSFLCFCYATANKVIKRKNTITKAQNQSQTKVLEKEKHMQFLKRATNIFGRKNI